MTTRQTTRYFSVSRALARVGIAPALVLVLTAGTALGQNTSSGHGSTGGQHSSTKAKTGQATQPAAKPAATRSATADAASSMVPQEQAKKKVGKSDDEAAGDIKVSADQLVDLHIKDEDLTRVLELLAIQSQRNIIPTKSVAARVSANLYGVTFYEALDALLHPNGFGWMERNNRIEVYTLEELKQIEAASRVRIAKVIKLNYLNAVDAGEFVEALLSEGGQIKTNGKTTTFAIPEKTPVGQDDFANDAMLVVYDYEENVNEIERLIKEIDTRPSQVLVEATILQTQLNEANAFGVDFSVLGDLNFTDFSGSGGPLSAVNSLIGGKAKTLGSGDVPIPGTDAEGRAIVSSPGNTAGPGTIKLGLVDNDVAIFLKMLDEVGDTTIISNPKVLALNRQPARVLVGRKVGYLNTTSTDTTTTQSVEFLDTGTQLYFRPFVSNEGLIRLELKPAVSEAVIRDAKDATGAAVTIPDEITNEIVTNVLVRDGQTVVLGGLFRESTQSSRRQVPFLGDIPILGAAFRGHDDETARNEIIFMITPSVVSDQVLVMQGERGSELVDKVRTGSRESLLLWSRERMSGQLLVEAEHLAADGKTDEALFKIEQSLAMNHTQPEAIALREKLSNKKVSWPGRSMLNDIVRGEAWTKPAANSSTEPSSSGAAQPSELIHQSTGNATATPNLDSQTTSPAGTTQTGEQPVDSGSCMDPSAQSTTEAQPEVQPATPPEHEAGSTSDETAQPMSEPVPTGEQVEHTTVEGGATTTSGEAHGGEASGVEAGTVAAPTSDAGLGTLTTEPANTTGEHNEQGNVEGTTPSTAEQANGGETTEGEGFTANSAEYIVAWTWFYTGFREFFIPKEFFLASGEFQEQTGEQATEEPATTPTVSNAPAENE